MIKDKQISTLASKLIKLGGEDAKLLDDFKRTEVTRWLDTGSLILNAHLSGSLKNGAPYGEMMTIAGDPKTGKSFLAINIAVKCLLSGGTVYYYETEGSPIRDRMANNALNTKYPEYVKKMKLMKSENKYEFFSDLPFVIEDKGKFFINIPILKEILLELENSNENNHVECNFLDDIIQYAERKNAVLDDALLISLIKYDFAFCYMKQNLIVDQPETIEDVMESANRILGELLDEKKKILSKKDAVYTPPNLFFILDSYAALNTRAQYENAEGDKGVKADMGTFAKKGKELFAMVSPRINKLGIGWVNTQHIYEKDMGNFRKRTPSGGNGPIYMSAILNMLKKSVDKDKETKEKKGIMVTSEIFESRHSKMTSVEFYISFVKGLNPYFGLQDLLSWDVCGIDRGRFVEFVDIAGRLLDKKVCGLDTICQNVFTYSDIIKVISKADAEALNGHIDNLIEYGFMKSAGTDKLMFTEKLLEQVKDGKYQKIELPVKSVVLNKLSPKWVVKHLQDVVEMKNLYTHEVFTDEVIDKLDVLVGPMFKFGGEMNQSIENEDLDTDTKDGLEDYMA
jgi:RecA/RadA recombinase